MWKNDRPNDIETRSFAIIRNEVGELPYDDLTNAVIYRVIHATADLSFAKSMHFSECACQRAQKAIYAGAPIVTDTNMTRSGVNQKKVEACGGQVYCYVAEEHVRHAAHERQTTRSVVAVEHAAEHFPTAIFVIGNAPTALLRLCELIQEKKAHPACIIGVPVGFVNVEESKEMLMKADVPHIVTQGRKGGSTVAAAIINALLYGEHAPGYSLAMHQLP